MRGDSCECDGGCGCGMGGPPTDGIRPDALPSNDLGQISHLIRQLRKVIIQPTGGAMRMFPDGPDTGLGVGAKQRGVRFIKQMQGTDEYRWSTPAEELVAYYRMTPGTKMKISDLANWMRMNGQMPRNLPGIVKDLGDLGISVLPERD